MELVFKLDAAMTVWIDGKPINTDGKESLNIIGVEDVLPSILDQLCEEYNDSVLVGGVRGCALTIATGAFSVGGIDRITANIMANYMALLAADMLRELGAGDWDFETPTALKTIRGSNPDVEEICTPKAPTA